MLLFPISLDEHRQRHNLLVINPEAGMGEVLQLLQAFCYSPVQHFSSQLTKPALGFEKRQMYGPQGQQPEDGKRGIRCSILANKSFDVVGSSSSSTGLHM